MSIRRSCVPICTVKVIFSWQLAFAVHMAARTATMSRERWREVCGGWQMLILLVHDRAALCMWFAFASANWPCSGEHAAAAPWPALVTS